MLNIQEIKKLLKENNIAVLKKFGQNFLISETILNKIIETAGIKPQDTILEIGPGLGVLTFELAKKASKVIAIEKDRKMAEILQKNLVKNNIFNVEVINEDALKVQSAKFKVQSYKVIANLPYNIATAIIMNFLEAENPPQKIVVMAQKEVAQRIIAIPPHMNKLAIFCQLYSTPKIISFVPSTAFYPKPKVDSAIIVLYPKNGCCKELNSLQYSARSLTPCMSRLQQIVNAGFIHPRKTLLNNFNSQLKLAKEATEIWLKKSGINPSQRAESLSLAQWQTLAKQYPQAS